jgi:hypothetical protein
MRKNRFNFFVENNGSSSNLLDGKPLCTEWKNSLDEKPLCTERKNSLDEKPLYTKWVNFPDEKPLSTERKRKKIDIISRD